MHKTLCKYLPLIFLGLITSARAQNIVAPQMPSAIATQIAHIVDEQANQSAHIGISIRALGTVSHVEQFPSVHYENGAQPELWQRDAQKRFIPASNAKSFTCAAALHYLGANWRAPTRVAIDAKRRGDAWTGEVFLIGGGDPSLKRRDLDELALQIQRRGIREIRGDIVGDGSAFGAETFGARYPDGWTLDDAIWYYGPTVSALAIDRNQVDVTIRGTTTGKPAQITVAPSDARSWIDARVLTTKTASDTIVFDRADNLSAIGPRLKISGTIGAGQTRSEGVAVPDASARAALWFKRALLKRGIRVVGATRSGIAPTRAIEVARRWSPPLSLLVHDCLKPSDNLYAEMLLRDLAFYGPQPATKTRDFAARGHELMLAWLKQNSVETADLQFTDGSGLSRYDLVTPRATTQMLAAIERFRPQERRAFYDGLPLAGVDGTLRKRFAGTPGALNVRAKTGTFSLVSTLSGYVTTSDNQRLAVSILCNFGRGAPMRDVQNRIFNVLASCRLTE